MSSVEPSSVDGVLMTAWAVEFARLITANATYLTDLDAALGDADHGINMHRGTKAVVTALQRPGAEHSGPQTPGEVGKQVATVLISSVGGASGPLYGTLFLRMAAGLGSEESVDAATFAAALSAGVVGLAQRGHTELGDKTMLDALAPAVGALDAALAGGVALPEALQRAAEAAADGRDATGPLVARKGRASYLGARSVGAVDPGAASAAMLIAAAAHAARGSGG